jgi:hypothetical protein
MQSYQFAEKVRVIPSAMNDKKFCAALQKAIDAKGEIIGEVVTRNARGIYMVQLPKGVTVEGYSYLVDDTFPFIDLCYWNLHPLT